MQVTDPNTLGAAPWYQSPVLISQVTGLVSAVIALFPKWGEALGIKSAEQANSAVTTVFAFLAVAAPLVGSILRVKSKIQPLTLTTTGAANHPATAVAAAKVKT